MQELIVSVSGLRGIVGQGLSPSVAIDYSAAYAAELGPGPVLVGRDGRVSGPMLADAVRSSLAGVGRQVIDADVSATPTVGVLIRHHHCAGGIQITASHNPPEYNGLKLFSPEGRMLDQEAGEAVLKRYHQGKPRWVSQDQVGEVRCLDDTVAEHCRLVLATVDVDRIRAKKFRVVLDSNHGAGSLLGRRLLEQLGCQVKLLGGVPDGLFDHDGEPLEENVADVLPIVTEERADIGFCQDPDADRLTLIDEGGRFLGTDYTLAICVDHVLRQEPGPVVTNLSSSRMTQDLAVKYGVPFFYTPVGEAHAVDVMLAHEAVFGGEGNGGIIDPKVGYVRDSFAGMARLLDAMAARGKRISELAEELPRYAMYKMKIPLDREKVASALDALEAQFSDATPSRLDGLRLDWPAGWLLVRVSNTEPIVRVFAESETADKAQQMCLQAKETIDRL